MTGDDIAVPFLAWGAAAMAALAGAFSIAGPTLSQAAVQTLLIASLAACWALAFVTWLPS